MAGFRVSGADRSATNVSGSNYVASLQVATGKCRVHKISVSMLAASDRVLWVFDTAAGSSSSAAPVAIIRAPASLDATRDWGLDGSVFGSGCYVVLATAAPTDATTTPTAAASNAAIIKVDYRVEGQ